MNDRYLAYFDLVEAFRQPGCPVCRRVSAASQRYLDTLAYEHVNDPEVRRRLRASWGLCNWHTWILADRAGAPFAAAAISEDLLKAAAQRVAALGTRAAGTATGPWRWLARLAGTHRPPALVRLYRRRAPCSACLEAARAETGAVEALATFISELAFQRAYEASDGLCVPHAVQAVERAAGRPAAETLAQLTVRRWEALRRTVERFVAKHEYRNTEPFSDAEAGAWRRALATLAGEPGLFGNDRALVAGGPRSAAGSPEAAPRLAPSARQADAWDQSSAADREAFERRKLELRIEELTRQLGEASSRAAALHYRLSRVAEDRQVLELNLAGERGANLLAEQALRDLRRENERLRAELAALRGSARPPASRP